ncbi:trypsin-like peptidase domain-containing protein (plasmid) [Lelliottia amnigena]|uniref:hypothetical protein n=1 Tax=Lelliottia amnigena TaxID=61646 RepID=UPI001F418D43|nr:hypothetical protein [Lelliottia amnigena]UJD97005.1 trypsin-like peptidase domain-containing protein [Lelliottia amnigena]
MLENYVCKIYVSDTLCFSEFLEATAFGFDDGTSEHLLTAAHVVTDKLGKKYPSSNNHKLYVIFHNHLGPVNTNPVPVEFILKDCNDQKNFKGNMPFVDSAKMILPPGMKQPVSHYFKRRPPVGDMLTFGVGYPSGQTALSTVLGKIKSVSPCYCAKHPNQHCTTRFTIKHYNKPGCSGGPYIISDEGEYYVIGSLIGEIKPGPPPTLSVQSSSDF